LKHMAWCAFLMNGFAAVSSASIIFDNLGPSFVLNPVTNYYGPPAGGYFAEPFVAASTGALGSIVTPLAGGVSLMSVFSLGLYSDSSGQPGALLENWNTTLPSVEALVTLSSSLHPTLFAGSSYWFVLSTPQDSAVWYMNGIGAIGGLWEGVALTPLSHDFETNLTAGLQVNSTPEPASWIFMASGLSMAMLARRRRTRP
jgi:hypothetical protein